MGKQGVRAGSVAGAIWIGLAATAAHAANVDFGDRAFKGARRATSLSASVDGHGMRVEAGGSRLSWNKSGLGVYGAGNPEIGAGEVLRIDFDAPVFLESLEFQRLFVERGYAEIGSYRIDGGELIEFQADPTQRIGKSAGALTVMVGVIASRIELFAPGRIGRENHEFALRGLRIGGTPDAVPSPNAPIPEPASACLLLFGGLGAALLLREI